MRYKDLSRQYGGRYGTSLESTHTKEKKQDKIYQQHRTLARTGGRCQPPWHVYTYWPLGPTSACTRRGRLPPRTTKRHRISPCASDGGTRRTHWHRRDVRQ